MNAKEIVLSLKASYGISYLKLCKYDNKECKRLYNQLRNTTNISTKSFAKIVDMFDYKVIVVPKDLEVEESIVLTEEEEHRIDEHLKVRIRDENTKHKDEFVWEKIEDNTASTKSEEIKNDQETEDFDLDKWLKEID